MTNANANEAKAKTSQASHQEGLKAHPEENGLR